MRDFRSRISDCKFFSRNDLKSEIIDLECESNSRTPYYNGSTSTIDDFQVREKKFPNARSYVQGGCLVFTTSNLRARRAAVRYCETCRIAERTWVELGKKERGSE